MEELYAHSENLKGKSHRLVGNMRDTAGHHAVTTVLEIVEGGFKLNGA